MLLALIALMVLAIALGLSLVHLKIELAKTRVHLESLLIAHFKDVSAHIPARSHVQESENIMKRKQVMNGILNKHQQELLDV